MKHLLTPTSIGEVLDKISILEIKSERIKDEGKLKNIHRERDLLYQLCQDEKIDFKCPLFDTLKSVNETLWDIEDQIRLKERAGQFDAEFVALARSVYITNDKRARIKFELNKLFKSELIEEKSYEDYTPIKSSERLDTK